MTDLLNDIFLLSSVGALTALIFTSIGNILINHPQDIVSFIEMFCSRKNSDKLQILSFNIVIVNRGSTQMNFGFPVKSLCPSARIVNGVLFPQSRGCKASSGNPNISTISLFIESH